jgi:hypothetical protein
VEKIPKLIICIYRHESLDKKAKNEKGERDEKVFKKKFTVHNR